MTKIFGLIIFILGFQSAHLYASDSTAYLSELKQNAERLELWKDLQWIRLGHYEAKWYGGYKSQVDGTLFFLAQDGKTDPKAELNATLEGFFSTREYNEEKKEEHPQCQFAARLRYLGQHLKIDQSRLPKVSCGLYEDFKKRLKAKSVSLVFSSFFMGSPSSTFGHTFLRVNGTRSVGSDGKHHELLDHGINYAAVVTTKNPIFYALFGLIGGFRGTFTSIPYYYKVREYNDYEARDLWSYDLELSDEEIAMLVDHLWELGHTYYDYFYFTENCSYHMFSTLDAAAPRLNLTDSLPYYVIPSDTVRQIVKFQGLIGAIGYRPSSFTQFNFRLDKLSPLAVDALEDIVKKKDLSTTNERFSLAERAQILDTALDYMEYAFPEDLLKENSESAQYKQKILISRASLGVRSEELKIEPTREIEPHRGHSVRKLTQSFGHRQNAGNFYQLDMRFAMHDGLDAEMGYPKNAQIEFAHWVGRWEISQNHFEVEDINLFRVTSLTELSRFQKSASYRVNVGARKVRDLNCAGCVMGYLEGGGGLSVDPWSNHTINLYSFLDGEIQYSDKFYASPVRLGIAPSLGSYIHFSPQSKMKIEARQHFYAFSLFSKNYEIFSEFRQSFSNAWGVSVSAKKWNQAWEGLTSAFFYF